MERVDDHPPAPGLGEADTLLEIARRLEVWASEAEKPTSHILRSLATSIRRCGTRLLLVGTDLLVSQVLTEEKAQCQEVLGRVDALPPWIGPLYLERIAQLAEFANLRHIVKRLADPHG
jgi:hypothetical protein